MLLHAHVHTDQARLLHIIPMNKAGSGRQSQLIEQSIPDMGNDYGIHNGQCSGIGVSTDIRSTRKCLVLPTEQDRTTDLCSSIPRIWHSSCVADVVSDIPLNTKVLEVDAKSSRYKSWKITLLIPWGALLMVAGFIMREVGAFDIENLGILIASIVLLLSGP